MAVGRNIGAGDLDLIALHDLADLGDIDAEALSSEIEFENLDLIRVGACTLSSAAEIQRLRGE